MNSLRIVVVSVLTSMFVWVSSASADYNAAKLRQVAGGYLDSVHVIVQLQSSVCGAYVRNEDTFANAMGDIAGYLDPSDVQELQSFLGSDGYAAAQAQTREFLEGWLRARATVDGGIDAACRNVSTTLATLYENARQTWDEAKTTYTR